MLYFLLYFEEGKIKPKKKELIEKKLKILRKVILYYM